MLIASLNIRLWKESILLAIFDVTVYSSELYKKMDAANVLKVLSFGLNTDMFGFLCLMELFHTIDC